MKILIQTLSISTEQMTSRLPNVPATIHMDSMVRYGIAAPGFSFIKSGPMLDWLPSGKMAISILFS